MKKLYYRADIDGLRALAIIPVIFFHLGLGGFSGGFIGVDIFFVISGYLITSIIIRELKEDRFSLVQFWERRVRRILPVLFFVLVSVTVASYFITVFPPDFISYGQSLAAQSLFLINIFFMRTGDYFAAPAETIPLLHTWSLAVEEQFYIVFPIAMLLLYRIRKQLLTPALIVAGILSLLYSYYLINLNSAAPFSLPFVPHVWGGATNANAGFYFPLARAWELIAGALLALCAWQIKNRTVAEITAGAGVVAIVLTTVFLTKDDAFPGIIALIPVLGTVAIIAANTNHRTLVAQILSFPVLVWIGLISYSLYLWHWPLIVLTKQYLNAPLSPLHTGVILIVTFILSVGSYRFIETPFRKKVLFAQRWQIFGFAVFSIVTLVGLGVFITQKNGLPERAPVAARAVALAAADTNPREYECFRNNYRQVFGEVPPCVLGETNPDTTPSFVLWGDSHANAVMPAFDTIAKQEGAQGIFFAVGGCPPLITKAPLNKDPQCNVHNKKAVTYITEHDIKTVFIVSSWLNDYPFGEGESITPLQALTETLNTIPSDTHVILMQRVPEQVDFDVRKLFYTAINTDTVPSISVSRLSHEAKTATAREALIKIAQEREHTDIIDPTDLLCSETVCSFSKSDTILYTDRNHLNTTGALMLEPLVQPFFNN